MTIGRIDLDGVGSASGIADLIHELLPDLPPDFSIEVLCKRFGIESIEDKPVTSFAAMLLMERDKAFGSIVVANGTSPGRRRFSIGHELGHFLIPSHEGDGQGFSCSHADLRLADTGEKDRRKKIEAEANRFAAHLLMPPKRIRANRTTRQPDLAEILRLARLFNVSKAAMARSYVDALRDDLAVLFLCNGRIEQVHKPADFPWIEPSIGDRVPSDSVAFEHGLAPRYLSEMEECEPETWLGTSAARKVDILSEQLLVQEGGYAMVLLHAEMMD
ncbi:ImmA/IrrE family metallo-endopeptidase [Qipengyuania sp. MTN3-11]|uniref:ImmA/IrrE family metallo-endopeptidase n=1 Tax=Qipengyuania sp. MTN3-11 TaxID=3056557 RepID=UPI0036F2025D